MNWDEYSNAETLPDDESPHFMTYYCQNELSENESIVVLMYFSFTTLTTVGFGDLTPKSDAERFYMAFGMLIGVSIFSYYMGELIEMINSGQDDSDVEADNLAKFFGLLKNFNYNQEIDYNFKRDIEQYFEYRWDNDKSRFFNSDDPSDFMNQLPE